MSFPPFFLSAASVALPPLGVQLSVCHDIVKPPTIVNYTCHMAIAKCWGGIFLRHDADVKLAGLPMCVMNISHDNLYGVSLTITRTSRVLIAEALDSLIYSCMSAACPAKVRFDPFNWRVWKRGHGRPLTVFAM